jgi:hypothetical protein
MRSGRLSAGTWVVGILSIALAGCGNATTGSAGSGGTTGTGGGAGGEATGGTGGTTTVATTDSGGTVGSGGTTSQPATGGVTGSGGTPATGGAQETGGTVSGTGGRTGTGGRMGGAGGTTTEATGGAGTGGTTGAAGGSAAGGATATGGRATGGAAGGGSGGTGAVGTGGTAGGRGGSTGTSTGTCTASKAASVNATGSGPHKVVVESNADSLISCGTIYRPSDLGGAEKYPIFVWGEGACTRNGSSNVASMGEIASHGYFVVADGPPGGGGSCASISMSSDVVGMAKPLLDYITWSIAENDKPCSAYYQSLDTTKVAADGFSCGGLMAEGTAGDPRMTTWGITSSGLTGANQAFYKTVHTPVKVLLGGSGDVAYTNGERDYDNISALGIPIVLFSKALGHGGDLGSKNGGDFTKVNLAWLNWQLKGDEGATGKGFLVGDSCTFCKDSAWEVKSANLP